MAFNFHPFFPVPRKTKLDFFFCRQRDFCFKCFAAAVVATTVEKFLLVTSASRKKNIERGKEVSTTIAAEEKNFNRSLMTSQSLFDDENF